PLPPARITTSMAFSPSGIAVGVRSENLVGPNQLPDAVVEREAGLVARLLDLLVGDDVVALVRILPDRRLQEREARDVDLDPLAELLLREVGVAQAHVVGPAGHGVVVLQPV